ncbi:DUF6538 domain-containing protein [Mesorhizobium sp. B2-3-5]|uniref:DUF6538 domain-containing protein n=1 Tax=Mesorhizobium sp. B2-3-5 TaxID=2589958 RepID=UPI0032B19D54
MSRPVKHRKTGVYWFRKRVPADVAALTGRKEVNKTLGTKYPDITKRNTQKYSWSSKLIVIGFGSAPSVGN